jgi:predicted RNase H-like HicB family nuclease
VSRWNGGPDFASVLKYLVAVRKRQDEVLAVKAKIKGEKAPKAKAAEPEPVVEKPKPAAKPEKVNARVAAVEPSAKARKIAGGYTIVVKPGTKSDGVRFLARVAELPLVMADGETEDEARDECLVAATAAVEELLDSGMEPPKPKPAAAPVKAEKTVEKPNALATGLLDMVKTVKTKRAVLDIAKAADKWLAEDMLTTSQWEAITDAVNARAALMEPEAAPKAKPKAAPKAKPAAAKPVPKPAAKPAKAAPPRPKAKVAGPGVKKGGGR